MLLPVSWHNVKHSPRPISLILLHVVIFSDALLISVAVKWGSSEKLHAEYTRYGGLTEAFVRTNFRSALSADQTKNSRSTFEGVFQPFLAKRLTALKGALNVQPEWLQGNWWISDLSWKHGVNFMLSADQKHAILNNTLTAKLRTLVLHSQGKWSFPAKLLNNHGDTQSSRLAGDLQPLNWKFTPSNRRLTFIVKFPSHRLSLRFSLHVFWRRNYYTKAVGNCRIVPDTQILPDTFVPGSSGASFLVENGVPSVDRSSIAGEEMAELRRMNEESTLETKHWPIIADVTLTLVQASHVKKISKPPKSALHLRFCETFALAYYVQSFLRGMNKTAFDDFLDETRYQCRKANETSVVSIMRIFINGKFKAWVPSKKTLASEDFLSCSIQGKCAEVLRSLIGKIEASDKILSIAPNKGIAAVSNTRNHTSSSPSTNILEACQRACMDTRIHSIFRNATNVGAIEWIIYKPDKGILSLIGKSLSVLA